MIFSKIIPIKIKNKKLVFNMDSDAGFYSEFNNMIIVLAYCIEKNIDFYIQNNPKNNFIKNVWSDYFKHYFNLYNAPLINKYNVRPYMTNGRSFLFIPKILKKLYNIDYFTQDIFNEAREYFSKKLNNVLLREQVITSFNTLVLSCYKFNLHTQNEVKKVINQISLPDDYIALHIRRGDKINEAPLYIDDMYIKQLPNGKQNLFIYTDDYNVITTIKNKYPLYTIYSLIPKEYSGYVHKEFINLPPSERYLNIINLFANVEIVKNASLFIGSFDSNFGMFLYLYREGIRCKDVNGNEWNII